MYKLYHGIAMFLVTSSIVINVPTRGLLAVETIHAIVQWLANLNIKRNMTSMFVNKKDRYSLRFNLSQTKKQLLVLQSSVTMKQNTAKMATFLPSY